MIKATAVKALVLAVGLFAATGAQAATWVEGNGQSCLQACQTSGMTPIATGTYQNGQHMFICAANANNEGLRPGYNLKPHWANACVVGWGGKEIFVKPYKCMCK